MLKEHIKTWLEMIDNSGIGFSHFQSIQRDNLTLIFEVKGSPLSFMIRQTSDNFDTFHTNNTEFKPGFPLRISYEEFMRDDLSPYEIQSVNKQFTQWLDKVVKRYLIEKEFPDLWSQLQSYSFLSEKSSISDDDLQKFSEIERLQIKGGIQEFKRLVVEYYDPVEEQLKYISERLGYLSEAIDRLNRFDWKAQALSILTSIAVNLSVDTEGGRKLFSLFQQALNFIIAHLPSKL